MSGNGREDRVFTGLMATLVVIGLVMVFSASGPMAHSRFGDGWYFLKRQLTYGFLPGVALFLILKRIDYRHYRRFWLFSLGLSLALLISVFVPFLAADWGTSRSWLSIFGFSLQPIELVKLTVLVFLAAWFERLGPAGVADLRRGFLPFLAFLAVLAVLVGMQPDIGGFTVLAGSAVIAWFAAGAAWPHLIGLLAAGSLGFLLAIKAAPYRAARLMTFLHPELDPLGIGYHINQAYLAIGSGGMLGLGLGHSRQKILYLPEAFGDSIFAVMAEELGFVLTMSFLFLLFALMWRGVRIAAAAPDAFGRILAFGIIGWIFCQSVFNIGSMMGLLPMTGLPLPFVSYGGTSLTVLLASMGIIANISSLSGQGRGRVARNA